MCPKVSGVAEVAEGRWWLECNGGWSAVRAEQELPGVSPESCRELLGVGSCLEQGKAILVGGAKAPRASTAGHRGCSRVTEEQNHDTLVDKSGDTDEYVNEGFLRRNREFGGIGLASAYVLCP
jgi:hypothetical protein